MVWQQPRLSFDCSLAVKIPFSRWPNIIINSRAFLLGILFFHIPSLDKLPLWILPQPQPQPCHSMDKLSLWILPHPQPWTSSFPFSLQQETEEDENIEGNYEYIFIGYIKGRIIFWGWTPKLTKCSYNSSNWVEGYEIVTDKYTL